MDCIEAEPIEMKFLEPIKRIVNKKVPDNSAVLAVKINSIAPRCAMPMSKKLWSIRVEIIPFRAEVVVDHIEQHHQTFTMSRLDQAFQIFRAAVGGIWGIGQNAVVSPIAFAEEI